jgi:hypothetical protein
MHLVPMDSPLRRIPTTVERRDVLFLDGIRYCFEAFELTSLRLAHGLHSMGQRDDTSPPLGPKIVEVTTDAWTMIDVVHRLRELLQQVPKLKKNEPELQLFIRKTESIEDLRHYFQHFRTEIDLFAERGMPLWGTLSWIFDKGDSEAPANHLLIPGTFFKDVRAMGCTFDTHENRYVERVVLHAGPQKVDLANLNDAVERFVEWYTRWFSTTFTGDDRYGADMHIRFSIVPAGSPTTNGDDFKIID